MIHIKVIDLINMGYALSVVVVILAIAFSVWYYFEVKRPVDKEIREGEKRMKDK